ncbi:hypothetical protein F4809DRAFT_470483 [Biscogniauxia mediterranea]|nr:hypothetical protein F4809DRAFT_470483 [Biscogniauxia mediterranea]
MPMDQEDDSDSSGIGYYPFVWVLIPIVFFGLVAVFLTCYRYRRRKRTQAIWEQQQQQYPHHRQHPPPRGGGGGDLEAMMPGPGRSRPRRFGFGSRDEGLNELGEAPPAYTAPSQKHSHPVVVDVVNGVELRHVADADAEVGTSGRLPRYEEAQQQGQGQGATATVAPPPRAVLPFS